MFDKFLFEKTPTIFDSHVGKNVMCISYYSSHLRLAWRVKKLQLFKIILLRNVWFDILPCQILTRETTYFYTASLIRETQTQISVI